MWEPDTALVFAVRSRSIPIGTLGPLDRAWLVASLTSQGWTVAAIAASLRCSLRLVQTIKSENMTRVAAYAVDAHRRLTEESAARRMEERLSSRLIADRDNRIERLTSQRDCLLDQIAQLQKELRDERSRSNQDVPRVQQPARTAASEQGLPRAVRVGHSG